MYIQKWLNGEYLLKTNEFWIIHLFAFVEPYFSAEEIKLYFGMKIEDLEKFAVDEIYGNIDKENQYTCYKFDIELSENYKIAIEYDSYPSEPEVDYLLVNKSWEDTILLATDGGNFMKPGLRWEEALLINSKILGIENYYLFNKIILLLFPSIYLNSDNDLNEVKHYLCNAWENLNFVKREYIELIVQSMIDNNIVDVKWSKDKKYGWINDNMFSYRNPNNKFVDDSMLFKFKSFIDFLEK
jgi:hypothetical protein